MASHSPEISSISEKLEREAIFVDVRLSENLGLSHVPPLRRSAGTVCACLHLIVQGSVLVVLQQRSFG